MSTPADKALQTYLDGDSALSGRYRAHASEQPPAHVDAAIAASARREVGARPVAANARSRKWYVPLSAAAVVTLASLLVLRLQDAPEVQTSAGDAQQQVAEQVLGPVPTVPAGGAGQPRAEAPRVAAAPQGPATASVKARGTAESVAGASRASADVPAERVVQTAPPPYEQEKSEQRRDASAALPAPVASPPAASAPSASEETREQQAPAVAAAPAARNAAPMPPAQDDVAPPAVTAAAEATHVDRAAGSAGSGGAQGAMEAKTDLALAKRESMREASAPSASEREAKAFDDDPQRWLAYLVDLDRRGEHALLERELRAFKQRYAQHALPPRLQQRWQDLQRESDQAGPR